ncbi:hypothetical protein H6504_02785 [Candidatus Woesearchaeota archaeon]|nr:hypothetical protein [Candidatus Woesearchaeota archaeon]
MGNFSDKVMRYFPFNSQEIKAVALTILILAFIVSFNDGSEVFDLGSWMGNLLLWLVIVAMSFLVKMAGHRLMGLQYGFRVEYSIWWYGILLSLAIAFVSFGHFWVLLTGGIMIHHLTIHRIGWFRYGTNMRALSMIAIAGPIANVLFATFVKTLQIWFHLFPEQSIIVDRIFLFNLSLAAYSMLPIPPLDGSKVLFDSRMVYAFAFGCFASYAILAWSGIYSYVFAFILGVLFWISYYALVERKIS